MVHDLYHDAAHGRLRHLLVAYPAVADLVKTAEFEDHLDQVPPTAFAWASERRFPVHTPAHAALSYLYAKTAAPVLRRLPPVGAAHPVNAVPKVVLAALEEALEVYGLDRALFEPPTTKEAACAAEDCLFPEDGTYPVRDAAEVKQAEARLLPQLPKLHPETRAEVFTRLAKAAALHDVKLQPISYKYAGLVLSDRGRLVDTLRARAAATKVAECRAAYGALAEATRRERGRPTRATLVKLAEAVGALDVRAGLLGRYDRGLPDPIATVFNTDKVAAGDEVEVGGAYVRPGVLADLAPAFFTDLLGDDVEKELAPQGRVDPQVAVQLLNALPHGDRARVGKALVQLGVGHAA